jgi:hypothetical protein
MMAKTAEPPISGAPDSGLPPLLSMVLKQACGSSRMVASADEIAVKSWQPIETAPKDGSPILAYQPDGGCVVISWVEYFDGGGVWTVDWVDGAEPPTPTHWMPLPEPPK